MPWGDKLEHPAKSHSPPRRTEGGRSRAAWVAARNARTVVRFRRSRESGSTLDILPDLQAGEDIKTVLTRIADHPVNRIAELLPWHWTARHGRTARGAGARGDTTAKSSARMR